MTPALALQINLVVLIFITAFTFFYSEENRILKAVYAIHFVTVFSVFTWMVYVAIHFVSKYW